MTLLKRMVRVARFDVAVIEEIEADRSANGQALVVVLLASVSAGIGWIGVRPGSLVPIATLAAAATGGWLTWAYLTYLVGTHWFPEPQTETNLGELLRTLGFAGSPAVLFVLAIVPGAASVVTPIVALVTLAAMVVAVRQALDYQSTLRAVAVCLGAWLVVLVALWVIGLFSTPVVS